MDDSDQTGVGRGEGNKVPTWYPLVASPSIPLKPHRCRFIPGMTPEIKLFIDDINGSKNSNKRPNIEENSRAGIMLHIEDFWLMEEWP
jgi:hypothetical protein